MARPSMGFQRGHVCSVAHIQIPPIGRLRESGTCPSVQTSREESAAGDAEINPSSGLIERGAGAIISSSRPRAPRLRDTAA